MSITMGRRSYHGKIVNDFDVPVTIGNFTSIADTLTVVGAHGQHLPAHDRNVVSTYPLNMVSPEYEPPHGRGPIVIGNDVWIGANVLLLDGITIGDGAIIGAGAVVASNVRPFAVVVGNPGLAIKFRFDDPTIAKLLRIAWWDWDDEKIRANIEDFKNVQRFVETWG